MSSRYLSRPSSTAERGEGDDRGFINERGINNERGISNERGINGSNSSKLIGSGSSSTKRSSRDGSMGGVGPKGGGKGSDGSSTPLSPTSSVRQSSAVMFVLDPWTARIILPSPGSPEALGLSLEELKECSMCDLAEGLKLDDWSKAMTGLASQQARKVVLRWAL